MTDSAATAEDVRPAGEFRYVEEFVRHQLSESLGGLRGMLEAALPSVAFTVAWMISRDLYPALGAAVVSAVVLAMLRLVQRQSIRYVATAVVPTAIAVGTTAVTT